MPNLTKLGPSPEHAKYQALLPDFWKKVEQQEADAIERGLPAKGMSDFAHEWFDAWANQDLDALRRCMAEDCGFIDSSTFQRKSVGREMTIENCKQCFSAFPDIAFYPQDGTNRSLPYADYFEGQWRIAVPWRGIARNTGPFELPNTGAVVPATGRCFNFIGVDRYTLTEDFRITHIDTDWDQLYGIIQLSPIRIPQPSPRVMRAAAAVARLAVPPLRFLGGNTSPNEHRGFAIWE
ncbi:nuclear transport factor 2 family protein [Mycolicibacter kumamotonensis]|uniref:nuclear transport factor 2 family protein n=1 Tax=Mycolicibacter kumamotonensis TaxID=354243 RepID=UPI000806527C|nr:nuclear transport factor 2 family protein [Mycolicibacter kumamotonensis]